MPFAGQLRLKTFLAIAGVTAAVGAVGLAFGVSSITTSTPEATPATLAAAQTAAEAAAEGSAGSASAGGGAVMAPRPFDATVIATLSKSLGSDKAKDILRSGPKINIYQDQGQATPNRVKVDLDRDESDDEKWTIDAGAITRQVSPADDGRYTETWTWLGGEWLRQGATPPSAATAAAGAPEAASPGAGRPVDVDALAWRGRALGADKRKDVTSGKPYKINVYQDAGQATANRLKIDLDRDDKWDEKITFESEKITREVAPADDEAYSERYHWSGAAWVPAP